MCIVPFAEENFTRHLGDYFFLLAAINNPMTGKRLFLDGMRSTEIYLTDSRIRTLGLYHRGRKD